MVGGGIGGDRGERAVSQGGDGCAVMGNLLGVVEVESCGWVLDEHRLQARHPGSHTLFMPGTAAAPRICGDFVRGTLHALGLGELADTAALCTSELVTNVHQHVRGEVHLKATVEAAGVRGAVYDRSPVPPCPRGDAGGEAEGGRGLLLVASPADGLGVIRARWVKGCGFSSKLRRLRGLSPGDGRGVCGYPARRA
jgi:anti-sigma regulatory factor (Ser/Thr protein kinase)